MTKEDFENIYKYYLDIVDQGIEYHPVFLGSSMKDQDESGNNRELCEMMFGYVCDYFLGNGYMNVIPDQEFMELGGNLLFHGFSNYDHGARELVYWNHHYGRGIMGGGLYTTTNIEEAYEYTKIRGINRGDSKKILPIKIIPNLIKPVDVEAIGKLAMTIFNDPDIDKTLESKKQEIMDLYNYYQELPDGNDKYYFSMCICQNASILAVMLGYNYVVQKKKYNLVNNDIVLDRSITIVPQSIAEDFLNQSQNFKDGGLNYQTMNSIKNNIDLQHKQK